MGYKYSPSSRFRSKKPIRSFRDLEVYQRTAEIFVDVMKKIVPLLPEDVPLKKELVDVSMKIPHYIAEAHSRRFDDKTKAMQLIEEVLFLCNKAMVYIEQVRDVYSDQLDKVVCNEMIKSYTWARQKIFNLYKAWKRFYTETEEKNYKNIE
ncbi:MAG: hypothetical protein NZ928_00530 [Endomicrobia bacterium]|nr:hypothetical protein [Endomicrobiia bacterium]MDW8056587.1 hypothetical protein [Elusimicrobiota bacterium]